jgi:flagellar motor switch protein FliM
MVMTISPEISYVILEQRLGGQSSHGSKSRHLTEIDQFLLRGLVEHMLNDIKASWSKVVAIEPSLEDSTVNQHWVQMVMGNERMMLITMEMNLQGVTGAINIYIPFNLLKPIVTVLKPHIFFTGRKERHTDFTSRNYLASRLTEINLPVRVYLGSTKVSLGFLAQLKPGDVIPLNISTNTEVPVQISNRFCYTAKLGKVGNHLAAQITQEISSTQELLP